MKNEDLLVFDRAEEIEALLTRELKEHSSDLLKDLPVEYYIELLGRYPSTASYKFVSPEVDFYCRKIREYCDIEGILELYHRLVMIRLIRRARENPVVINLPSAIRDLLIKNFFSILKRVGGRPKPGAYLYSSEKFNKNLSVCRLAMIPLGAQKVYVGRMSRGFLFKRGFEQFKRGLRLVCLGTHGFKPIYRMHTDSRDRDLMKEFNPDGWRRFYIRTALLLEANRNIIGLCGSSWFFDPVVPEINPELAYLRELALEVGAEIFYLGPTEGAVRDATFMNRERQKLYEEGKYKPTVFTMVVPRKQLMQWADRQNPL